MALKKDQALQPDYKVKFTRPMSDFRVVLMSIERGNHLAGDIAEDSKLTSRRIKSAIGNLLYNGNIKKSTDRSGRTFYYVPGQHVGQVGDCWKYASSAFTPSLPK
jgi:hypothetical protein